MCRFLETICVKNGKIWNLEYHQERVNRTFRRFFWGTDPIILKDIISEIPDSGWYKWRIVYDNEIRISELISYTIKKISRIFLIDADFDYSFKYEDRPEINRLNEGLPDDSAAVFCMDGCIGDAEYANVAFELEGRWYTPDTPFLEGTKRAFLIKESRLSEKHIKKEDIKNYSKLCLINAMLDLGDCVIAIDKVSFW